MNKISLLVLITFVISQNIFSQLNLSFENWTLDTTVNLNGYQTAILDNPQYGWQTVIKSTDSYLNNYSVKLETVLTPDNDTLLGYFINGNPETGEGGQAISLFGVDSIVGYCKYNIQTGDTALLLCMAKSSGIQTGGGIYNFTGTNNTWTRFSLYVGAATADSVIIAAASSNALLNSGIPGSWLMLDNIQLKYNTSVDTIYNYNFENWDNIIRENPTGWYSTNNWLTGYSALPVIKTTDAQTGTYAVDITTTTHPAWGDTMIGMITNGIWDYTGLYGGSPYTDSPTAVELYYKYMPAGTDTAVVSFQFLKNGNMISWNGTAIFNTATTYTYWNQVINLPQSPDTLLMVIHSGNIPGSNLIVDGIYFTFPVSVNNDFSIEQLTAYPVPAYDKLNFKLTNNMQHAISISIMDITGKTLIHKIFNKPKGSHKIEIDISGLSKGTYYYKIIADKKTYTKQFIISK